MFFTTTEKLVSNFLIGGFEGEKRISDLGKMQLLPALLDFVMQFTMLLKNTDDFMFPVICVFNNIVYLYLNTTLRMLYIGNDYSDYTSYIIFITSWHDTKNNRLKGTVWKR